MKELILSKGCVTIVDDEDFEEVSKYKWYTHKDGYACRNDSGKTILLHRFLMKADKESLVDHKNHDKLDNRKANLRLCSKAQNLYNSITRNPSEFKGVSKHRRKWRAAKTFQGKRIHIGLYFTAESAAKAYDTKAKELFGDFAYLNFP